ncbi:rhamnulokinase family protein [Okibacterium endophyticum]
MPGERTGFVAIDLGSSNGRVMLGIVDDERCDLHTIHRFANVPLRGGTLAWDVDALFSETLDGLALAVAFAADNGVRIRGIGVSAWGVDYARLAPNGDLLGVVKHHRAADHDMPRASAALVSPETAWAVTGVLDQAINTSHQLRTDASGGELAPDQTVLLVPDLWVQRLTGAIGAERTIASTTGLLDRTSGTWSQELTDAWGIRVILPPLVDDGTFAGYTRPEVTGRIGSASALPVYYVAGHDTASAAITVPDPDPDPDTVTGIVSAGSWAVTGVQCDVPVLSEEARQLGFTNELGAQGCNLLVRNLSGMWLLQECVRAWSEATGERVDLLDLLREAEQSEHPGVIDVSDPQLQLPGGLAERIGDRCEAAGHPRPAREADTVMVILRSLAVAYRDTVNEAARLVGKRPDGIRIISGGSRNALLCRLTADLSGLPVEAGPAEATSLGIVFRLAVASGRLPDAAAARSLIRAGDDTPARYTPNAHTPNAHTPAHERRTDTSRKAVL